MHKRKLMINNVKTIVQHRQEVELNYNRSEREQRNETTQKLQSLLHAIDCCHPEVWREVKKKKTEQSERMNNIALCTHHNCSAESIWFIGRFISSFHSYYYEYRVVVMDWKHKPNACRRNRMQIIQKKKKFHSYLYIRLCTPPLRLDRCRSRWEWKWTEFPSLRLTTGTVI